MQKFIYDNWNLVFDHRYSPLKNIPDVNTRHMILQILAWMWVTAFSIMIGSWTGFLASAVGHIAILAALAVTVGTYTVAQNAPQVFTHNPGRRKDGEHE
mgnify:CR=1 FL=1